MEEIRNRVERWKYDDMVSKNEKKPQGLFGHGKPGEIKDYSETMAFGTSFITLMFLGFILGYFIGKLVF